MWLFQKYTSERREKIEIRSARLPAALDGFRIVQISDYHRMHRRGIDGVLKIITRSQPDIIALTGDMAEDEFRHNKQVLELIEILTDIAPVFAVQGNHERRMGEEWNEEYERRLREMGVTPLKNQWLLFEKNGASLCIGGIDDPSNRMATETTKKRHHNVMEIVQDYLEECERGRDHGYYSVLLAHRPYYVDLWKRYKWDLVLSGHLHGGMVRMAGKGLRWLTKNPYFPQADAGLYQFGGTQLYINRGLGYGSTFMRVNNPPEVTLLILRGEGEFGVQ